MCSHDLTKRRPPQSAPSAKDCQCWAQEREKVDEIHSVRRMYEKAQKSDLYSAPFTDMKPNQGQPHLQQRGHVHQRHFKSFASSKLTFSLELRDRLV